MKTLLFLAWGVTRLAFLFLWLLAEPIGELNVWLKGKYLAH